MAFEFFSLVASFVARDGPLVSALGRIRASLTAVFNWTQRVTQAPVTPADAQHGVRVFGALTAAATNFHGAILGLGGLHLGDVLRFGTVAGLAAGLKSVVGSVMQMNDQLTVMASRFDNLGLNGQEMATGWRSFSRELADAAGISNEMARSTAMTAITRGPNPANYKATAAAAAAISAQTGLSLNMTMRMVNMGEENYRNYARLLKLSGLQVGANASQAQIMERVNFLIHQGMKVQEVQQTTFAGRLTRLNNLFEDLKFAVGAAIGAPLLAMLADAMAGVSEVTSSIIAWVKNNDAVLRQVGEIAGKVIAFGGALLVAITVIKIFSAWLTVTRAFSLTWAATMWLARTAVMGLAGAIRGLVASTGVGILIAIAVTALQAAGAFDDWSGAVETLHTLVNSLFGDLIVLAKQAWAVVGREAMVAWGMLQESWGGIREILMSIWDAITNVLGGALSWILAQFGYTWGGAARAVADFSNMVSYWWHFVLDELGVLDIRIKQFALGAKMAWFSIPGAVQFLWDTMRWFADYLAETFLGSILFIFKTIGKILMSVGSSILWFFSKIKEAITGIVESVQDDIEHMNQMAGGGVEKEIDEAAEKAKRMNKELEDARPKFGDPKYRYEGYEGDAEAMSELDRQADERKQANIKKQDALRRSLDAQAAEKDAKKRREEFPDQRGGTPPRGGFSDLQSVWKKVQEQAAGGQLMTQTELAKRTAAATEESNGNLARIREIMDDRLPKTEKKTEPIPQ